MIEQNLYLKVSQNGIDTIYIYVDEDKVDKNDILTKKYEAQTIGNYFLKLCDIKLPNDAHYFLIKYHSFKTKDDSYDYDLAITEFNGDSINELLSARNKPSIFDFYANQEYINSYRRFVKSFDKHYLKVSA